MVLNLSPPSSFFLEMKIMMKSMWLLGLDFVFCSSTPVSFCKCHAYLEFTFSFDLCMSPRQLFPSKSMLSDNIDPFHWYVLSHHPFYDYEKDYQNLMAMILYCDTALFPFLLIFFFFYFYLFIFFGLLSSTLMFLFQIDLLLIVNVIFFHQIVFWLFWIKTNIFTVGCRSVYFSLLR